MSLNYVCPSCKGYLNMDDCLIFSVETKRKKAGLISLHPELGNYEFKKHPDFDFKSGDELEFYCPICHEPLASDKHKNLAKIIMVDEDNNQYDVLFSKVVGEKSTYKIEGETMEVFGDDSAEYIDFINLSMNF